MLDGSIIQIISRFNGLVVLQWLSFSLPVVNMVHDYLGRGLGCILSSDAFDEVTVGICIY